MSEKQEKLSFFIKDEATIPLDNGNFANYTGVVGKIPTDVGNLEIMPAVSVSESKVGGFLEGKFTTSKIKGTPIAFESRTRIVGDKPFGKSSFNTALTQRVAAKANVNLGKGWSVYEIAGASANISFNGDGVKSITPTSITGVGYKNVYCELGLSKSYSPRTNTWGKTTPEVYVGFKIPF